MLPEHDGGRSLPLARRVESEGESLGGGGGCVDDGGSGRLASRVTAQRASIEVCEGPQKTLTDRMSCLKSGVIAKRGDPDCGVHRLPTQTRFAPDRREGSDPQSKAESSGHKVDRLSCVRFASARYPVPTQNPRPKIVAEQRFCGLDPTAVEILVGPAETGKLDTLIGLGVAAVATGHKVECYSAADLVETLYRSLAGKSRLPTTHVARQR